MEPARTGRMDVHLERAGVSGDMPLTPCSGTCDVLLVDSRAGGDSLTVRGESDSAAELGTAMRQAPLVTVVSVGDTDLVALVAEFRIDVTDDLVIRETITIHMALRSDSRQIDFCEFDDLSPILESTHWSEVIGGLHRVAPHYPSQTPQEVAAAIIKNVCEHSRDALTPLRNIRRQVEYVMADVSSNSSSLHDAQHMVGDLVCLNVLLGRAREESQRAISEGLSVWRTDDAFYHYYRKRRDPSLLNGVDEDAEVRRSWARPHDAAIRNCEQFIERSAQDLAVVQSALVSATGLSSAKQADAQAEFNLYAAVISTGIGLPALLATLLATIYAVDQNAPFSRLEKLLPFVPILFAIVVAGFAGMWALPSGSSEQRRRWRRGINVILVMILSGMIATGLFATFR